MEVRLQSFFTLRSLYLQGTTELQKQTSEETYLHFVISLQTLEGEGSHNTIRYDQRDKSHVREEARAYLPRVMKERTAPTGCNVFRVVHHLV
jgi:hypothetical protein